MDFIKTILKTIFLNIDEEWAMIAKIKTVEEDEIIKVRIMHSVIAGLALFAFIIVIGMQNFWNLDTSKVILHSTVSLTFYFVTYFLKNSPINDRIKLHICSTMVSIEYLILFYILYDKLTVLYWFMLLLVLIPMTTFSNFIIAGYMIIVFAITFFVSTFIFPQKSYVVTNAFGTTAIIIFSLNLLIIYFVFVTYKILLSKSENENKRLFEVAYHDLLTKLPNRQFVYNEIKTLIEQKKVFYLIYFNINNFKSVNETINHKVGDQLLIEVANILANKIKKDNIIARTNGDEFVYICKNDLSEKQLRDEIETIIKALNEDFIIDNYTINISLSCSVVRYPDNASTSEELLKALNIAFYQARQMEANKIVFYNEKIGETAKHKAIFEENLLNALNREEFYLVFQPIVTTKAGEKVTYFEALLRWNSENLGQIPPLEFIHLAEHLGIIHEIGLWVLREACQMVIHLNQQFPRNYYTISVNISALQLKRNDFISNVKNIIKETGVNPRNIIIELTETVFIDNSTATRKSINELKQIGIRTAIDDFGTGYSSFSYLTNLCIDYLKIDKSFIDNMLSSTKKTKVVQSIVDLGHTMDMYVTAEGVETKEQVEFLNNINCDCIQGYYYSKPLKANDLMEYLKK